jgi:thiol-disulfide isomerase/thioredoxin
LPIFAGFKPIYTMKKSIIFGLLFFTFFVRINAQTPLTEAVEFSVKTLNSETIRLFPILDAGNFVVIDFFSTSCGPCQTFAYDFEMAYQNFGSNQGNVFFLAINYNSDNRGVEIFDSIFNITLPSASGLEGGGNAVYEAYGITAYPTVILISPDHHITEQFIWEPTAENITNAVVSAGGTLVGEIEKKDGLSQLTISPNPGNDVVKLIFDTEKSGHISYQIIDLTGRVLLKEEDIIVMKGNNQIKINLTVLPSGVYLVKLFEVNKRVIVQKIIVE